MKKNETAGRAGGGRGVNNYLELIFVFAAFLLMALTAWFATGRILRNRLLAGAEGMLYTAEANVRAGFSEAELTVLNSSHVIQEMIAGGASHEEILSYLTGTSQWMQRREGGLLEFLGVYGYIRGRLMDSQGLNPGEDYIPQGRPWYQTALRSGDGIGYTAPYTDVRTGETVISVVRNIPGPGGETLGILVADVSIGEITRYINSLALAPGGYGMLISQDMTVMSFPDRAFLGRPLRELGGGYEWIAPALRRGDDISAREIRDAGGKSIVFFRRIFNGWYVGSVTPYGRFFGDLYIAGLVLALLGLVLAVALCLILLRLFAAKRRSDEESKSKSSFLARMSHEIRTPLNAVIGMSELALREEQLPRMNEMVRGIRQAGYNLLTLVNDILDFSKIDAGVLQITPVPYSFSALLNDAINIVQARIAGKPVLFTVDAAASIPAVLVGDELRIRQILLNLLSNAAKYTDTGHIRLMVNASARPAEIRDAPPGVILNFTVEDTGRGIRGEDMPGLFGSFVRFDMERNRHIEGTGLGLSITRSLCRAMGGDVAVKSEYGRGSVFTAFLFQEVLDNAPYAAVEFPEKKGVLLYEKRAEYALSLGRSLESLGIPVESAVDREDFFSRLGNSPFVFIAASLYGNAAAQIRAKGVKPVLLTGPDEGSAFRDTPVLAIPAHAASIARILAGRAAGTEEASGFKAPGARILIVDDLPVNLTVAEGLMDPYGMRIDTCLSGAGAIEKAKANTYDLVFMDHMMPGMDGIEAAAGIRSLGREYGDLPIIALTANAVSGMKEMFLSKGFNDFLSKPIEISRLDGILRKWVPRSKQENPPADTEAAAAAAPKRAGRGEDRAADPLPGVGGVLASIPGIDTAQGLALTGGSAAAYRKVLAIFTKDAEDRLPLLGSAPPPEGLKSFVTQVHALKSAAASIGAAGISAQAAKLEEAGAAADLGFIGEHLPDFAGDLAVLLEGIRAALKTESSGAEIPVSGMSVSSGADAEKMEQSWRELAGALKTGRAETIDRLLEELSRQNLGTAERKILEAVSDAVLVADFTAALEIMTGLPSGGDSHG
ncbi:MAG: response regulator [Treponema sp.]|jgi:signal transduction histidine kinase/CheY-like chemotaxis protein|nr:response regulator [Treponema sp.]